MPRLFVAIDLPSPVTAALSAIQPPGVPGLRLIDRSQMHLTLHFLGPAVTEVISAALEEVAGPPVPLVIRGVGRFRGKSTILWAGVQETGELLHLHSRIAAALRAVGYVGETRPYHPHVTLARCEPRVPASAVTEFLDSHADFTLPGFVVDTFHLYSSELGGAAPIYRRESTFELIARN